VKTKAKVRKVVQCGTSLMVYLPTDFVRKSGLAKGDVVVVVYDDKTLTILNPNVRKGEDNDNRARDI